MAGSPPSAQLGEGLTGILELPDRLAALTGPMGERAARLVEARLIRGRTEPPPELHGWLRERFGSVDAVREQAVVHVTSRAIGESTIISPLRGRRPMDRGRSEPDFEAELVEHEGDPFCEPTTGTPADPYGRVAGDHVVARANAALADAHHAVLVFDRHDPLAFDRALVSDVLQTGRAWAEHARASDPVAVNYLLIWNCLWRAGGSIVHGHAQALLGSGTHYQQLERFRRDVAGYAATHRGDLVEELVAVHRSLGLTIDVADGVTLLASLTPRKERELWLVAEAGTEETAPAFAYALGSTLEAYRDRVGVRSFNLALWRPPLANGAGWEGVPPIVRIVDRGDPASRPSDIGAMELFGTPIVSADPFDLIEQLR